MHAAEVEGRAVQRAVRVGTNRIDGAAHVDVADGAVGLDPVHVARHQHAIEVKRAVIAENRPGRGGCRKYLIDADCGNRGRSERGGRRIRQCAPFGRESLGQADVAVGMKQADGGCAHVDYVALLGVIHYSADAGPGATGRGRRCIHVVNVQLRQRVGTRQANEDPVGIAVAVQSDKGDVRPALLDADDDGVGAADLRNDGPDRAASRASHRQVAVSQRGRHLHRGGLGHGDGALFGGVNGLRDRCDRRGGDGVQVQVAAAVIREDVAPIVHEDGAKCGRDACHVPVVDLAHHVGERHVCAGRHVQA